MGKQDIHVHFKMLQESFLHKLADGLDFIEVENAKGVRRSHNGMSQEVLFEKLKGLVSSQSVDQGFV